MAKEVKNQYGINIDDIFCLDSPCGLSGHCISFFQVVALRGKSQVVIKEIEFKKIKENEEKKNLVIAQKNKFKEESCYIKDNKVGAIKLVQKFYNNKIYIDIHPRIWYENAYLWDGEPKVHDIDYR